MSAGYEAVIGLEVHCQLSTHSKIFCGCPTKSDSGSSVGELEPNSNTCPVCTGQPGSLPVLNRKVVEFAIRAGLATGCKIQDQSVFARKNYFYPDLPKGYQISQYELPICTGGSLEIETSRGQKRINIQRIHMEEDAGKNVHMSGYSLVNLSRAGVPLIEIVSGPEMSSSEEAGAYLRILHSIVTYLGICDGNMQEGNFRFDANISVMPQGSTKLGTRVEVKNVNSFRFVEKAIDFEIARQIEIVKSGGRVVQETRLYDSAKGVTASMRSKEEAEDYRYFPDPDLIQIKIPQGWVEEIKNSLPELPSAIRAKLMGELGLSSYDASALTSSKAWCDFFLAALQVLVSRGRAGREVSKPLANLLTSEGIRLANDTGVDIQASHLKPESLADIATLAIDQVVSSGGAKQLLAKSWESGEPVARLVESLGLKQVNDTGSLEPAIDKIIAAHPSQVAEYRSGKEKLIGFFVGQVMKETGGKANPALLSEMIKKKLAST